MLINFRDYKRTGNSVLNYQYSAVVDDVEEIGKWWWKKTVSKERDVHKQYGGHWFFVDTGEWCPSYDVEAMERSYNARHGNQLREDI
jgi:hypothetical protein